MHNVNIQVFTSAGTPGVQPGVFFVIHHNDHVLHTGRSRSTIAEPNSEIQTLPKIDIPPSDKVILKILSLRLSDSDPRHFAIKVTFFDQLLVHAIIKSIGARDKELTYPIANGTMTYDPSDYEKMCLFADFPLVVQIQPLRNIDENKSEVFNVNQSNLTMSEHTTNISCCNVDILSIFLGVEDQQKMTIKKRMEPMVQPSALRCNSWDTLPLLTMELTAERNPLNIVHHKVLKDANWMQLTLVASYNMYIPFENDYVYTAASKTPLYGEENANVSLVTYSQGYREPQRFNCMKFFPKWESLRCVGATFTHGDQKLQYKLEEIQNEHSIDLTYYLNRMVSYHTSVWGSFHRTLMLKGDQWLWRHLRDYKWPFELHIYGENEGYSFMAFLNCFQLLFPGEHTIRLAVPLQWINADSMMKECGCDLLLTPNDIPPSVTNEKSHSLALSAPKTSKMTADSIGTSASTLTTGQYRPTGADGNDAFVVVEVKLGRPLKAIINPPRILKEDISAMLTKMEIKAPKKRMCTGRGQLERDWKKTVRGAANSLRLIPYYEATEFCTFNRQLSETRTRVELTTSFWQDAAIFVNNNFVTQPYLQSDEVFEELVMMSHACLMRSASTTLMGADRRSSVSDKVGQAILAARHARQMQDTLHAVELYLRLVVSKPRNPDYWRELSTCLKDLDRDWANVCLNKAVVLDPRHPLTLLSKGAMLFEEDPPAAEPFFIALLTFNPTWTTMWTIASVYFYERELFHMADLIMTHAEKYRYKRCPEKFQRTWEQELGDWWHSTPLLPSMSLYYDAADLLLRLRAVSLAEVCVARVLSVAGETAPYYHLVGLCCRLRGDYQQALCHLTVGLGKFGEICYLRSLEAEIQHRLGNIQNAIVSFGKAGNCGGSFSILMSLACGDQQRARVILLELVRRQASTYAWTALADDWVKTDADHGEGDVEEGIKKPTQQINAKSCAIACAIQALKMDRLAGRAWAILAKLVKPKARRLHCLHMANVCGWQVTDEDVHFVTLPSQHSLCHRVGTALRECHCNMCDKTRV